MIIALRKICASAAALSLLTYSIQPSYTYGLTTSVGQHAGASRSAAAPAPRPSTRVRPSYHHQTYRPPQKPQQYAPSRPPQYEPGRGISNAFYTRSPIVSPTRNQLRSSSGMTWKTGADYERQARLIPPGDRRQQLHEAALHRYVESVNYLEATRQHLTEPSEPESYVPLARGHLDIARTLTLLHRDPEAKEHLNRAQNMLLSGVLTRHRLSRDWLWKAFYLLGDINLLQMNQPIAAAYYQKAADLDPDFVPAAAMVQYLGGAPPPEPIQPSVILPGAEPQTTVQYPDGQPPPGPVQQAPIPTGSGTTPVTQSQVQKQQNYREAVNKMASDFSEVTPAQGLNLAGSTYTLVAEIFEIGELGPLGTAIGLGTLIDGMLAKTEIRFATNR
jgi:tetratricopeptide (TPR) repeat protein